MAVWRRPPSDTILAVLLCAHRLPLFPTGFPRCRSKDATVLSSSSFEWHGIEDPATGLHQEDSRFSRHCRGLVHALRRPVTLAQDTPANRLAAPIDPFVEKRRVVVMTDIANEPDDQMSMVRFLVYSNQFDVEA